MFEFVPTGRSSVIRKQVLDLGGVFLMGISDRYSLGKRSERCASISDDNPYSECQFRTMKFRPEFPNRFGCMQESRAFS